MDPFHDRFHAERLLPPTSHVRDGGHPASSVAGALELDDNVDGRVDLIMERLERHIDIAHGGQGLKPHESVLG